METVTSSIRTAGDLLFVSTFWSLFIEFPQNPWVFSRTIWNLPLSHVDAISARRVLPPARCDGYLRSCK
jgi:hypothetical protein